MKFAPDTPEWQLHENMIGCERAAIAYQSDAERFAEKAAASRAKADLYRAALAKLIAPGSESK